jgi:hypothetical protein
MIIVPPTTFRPKHKVRLGPPPTPPVALTLVSAHYGAGDWLRLVFDRAINIDAIDASQIIVDDDTETGDRYDGTGGAELLGPATVQFALNRIGSSSESGEHLIASASSGIVASDDGGTWAGVGDLALPFP